MKRIGILGGTFNPIHLGHLAMAQIVKEQIRLDKVIFVPSCLPPHKSSAKVISAKHRLKMVRLAVSNNPDFAVSDLEIRRGGKSYSVDTAKHFRRLYPKDTKFFFIVGGDMLAGLKKWKNVRELLGIVTFVAVNRPGYLNQKSLIRHVAVSMPDIEISSSDLRRRVAQKKTIKYLIPDKVIQYIRRNHLYQ